MLRLFFDKNIDTSFKNLNNDKKKYFIEEWTFTRNINSSDKTWYLSNIEDYEE
ncbi:MAG TPA: hypothetical protein QKA14_02740 [Candidatus Megaira endosymbiont of Hartmannula sinica]|nr:hypothetical protein [Candidatus Megaera endosymbiont of Hartmannula sinica]